MLYQNAKYEDVSKPNNFILISTRINKNPFYEYKLVKYSQKVPKLLFNK